jgi:hypothetical protein
MKHPADLTDDEYAALQALKRGDPVPDEESEVWTGLRMLGLVWRDPSGGPIRLTAAGQRYPAG